MTVGQVSPGNVVHPDLELIRVVVLAANFFFRFDHFETMKKRNRSHKFVAEAASLATAESNCECEKQSTKE